MADWPLIRFVDRVPITVVDTPDTLLELNGSAAGSFQVDHADFSLGAPTFEGDPDSVGVEDEYRQLRATPSVAGDYTAAAAALSSLARILQRDETVLMYQHGSSNKPTYFRVYRSQLPELEWDEVSAQKGKWTLPMTLWADPYGYGPRELVTGAAVTINNDPAHATNPCSYIFPSTIKGDAPTPLQVKIDPSIAWTGYQPLLASTAFDSSHTPTGPIVWQTGSFTAGTDTTLSTADATMSGGSRSTVSFATDATMVTRLSGNPPGTVPPAGLYKVLVRVARSDTSSTFGLRLGRSVDLAHYFAPNSEVAFDRATSPASGHAAWIDLGDMTFPFGIGDVDLGDTTTPIATSIALQAERRTGTGSLYVDCFMLIPIQTAVTVRSRVGTHMFLGFGVGTSQVGYWDGVKRRFQLLAFGTALVSIGPPRMSGGWPEVVPGANNMFHLLHQTMGGSPFFTSTDSSDSISATADVDFWYYPRYLNLRPDAD